MSGLPIRFLVRNLNEELSPLTKIVGLEGKLELSRHTAPEQGLSGQWLMVWAGFGVSLYSNPCFTSDAKILKGEP